MVLFIVASNRRAVNRRRTSSRAAGVPAEAAISVFCCANIGRATRKTKRSSFFIKSLLGTDFGGQVAFVVEGMDADEAGCPAQLLFDAQQLVVLGDAIGTRSRARFDLS